LPGLCLAAGATLVAAGDACSRLVAAARTRRLVGTLVPAGAAALMAVTLVRGGVQPYLESQVDLANSRVEAIDWLRQSTTSGDRILVAAELGFLPTELAKVPGEVVVSSAVDRGEPSPYRAQDFDVVVSGPIDAPMYDWARPGPIDTLAATFGSTLPIRPEPELFEPPDLPIWIHRP
jgi:hypothetical protein